ncbi:MAG: hypothetical protein KF735_17555 [Chelatococcus sp.]|jgi:hypothetical protein|uniref:hypothetical protein n=1 Tax=unclassified Chelatococcus TaxID=2638111 RepID=UPI001BD1197D|nr:MULTISPECIES: hypothetical protein [unclassified Chelatococcus]CAH1652422.1 conserved hypothetical protein [Hyphomicrobiales bacterium]MBS7700207.1 hypothetical protein [Chelatococcus sp. YT9]MBS7739982.1 hypothetical protein [Chelatococcus sp. HY11]MBX3539453.1 hypothetical protein [Chelatococcus sp.]MBX3547009.1 hypothetical protein [Chelatococcus sp.]
MAVSASPTPQPRLELNVPDLDLTIGMRLDVEGNPELCAAIRAMLPLKSLFGHVVISGDGIWLPSRLVYMGKPVMVTRTVGSVYLNAPGQSICLTYGAITETAVVNEFAHVEDDSLAALKSVGDAVWRRTVTDPVRRSVLGILREAKD